MSKFTSAKRINTRWRNNDFIGEPGSSHTFPDAFHEEFLVDWAYQIQIGDITITETPTTGNIQMATLTVGDIVVTGTATGNFGSQATVVQGTAPISVSTSSNTATVSIDQSALTAGAATTAEGTRTYVKNATASAMTKGQAVYINGATGTNVTIELATATSEVGSSKTLGLLYQDLAVNAFGWVVESGFLAGIDTSAASAGQAVYLGNTPGSLVYGSPPAEPSNGVYLGVVARSNVNTGEILVKVQNGYEIDELHDVSAASPSDGDIIQYKNTSGLWTKQSLTQAGIAASAHTHSYISSVSGSAPIVSNTDTAGAVTVSLNASYSTSTHLHDGVYQVAGNYSTDTHTHTLPPTGSILMWATTSAPTGWLFCDGTSYAYNTYPTLGALFGGVAGGNFNVPDLRDRFIAGASAISAATNNAGTFAPNTSNIHTHTTDIAHGHADTIAVSTHGDHTHTTDPAAATSGGPSATTSLAYTGGATNTSFPSTTHTHSTNVAATASGAESTNLTHTVTGGVTSLGTTSVTSSNGSLLPKAALLNFIIKS